jgi:serine/threonine protein kinase
VQVFAWGEQAGQPYFVLELVDGPSLAQKLQGQPQPPREAARLVLLLARAVQAAHQKGIIHLDLKPANVLLASPADEPALNTAYGCPKITDFGLAKLEHDPEGPTASGPVQGTPCYMAPEQTTGKTHVVGPPADLYALGALLYELLTGQPPFLGDGLFDTLEQVRRQPPTPVRQLQPEVPAALEAICLRCLEKQPADRYPSAAALADELGRFLEGEALPPPVPPRLRRSPWALALGAIALLLAIGSGLYLAAWTPQGETGNGVHSRADALAAPPLTVVPFKGSLDILISEPNNPRRQLVALHEPAARPLKVADEIRIEAELNRPGFLYVLWIDTQGQILPVYPWLEGDWQRWREEQPLQVLSLPEKVGEIYKMAPGQPGMETLLLLVRDTQWPRQQDLRALVGQLDPQPLLDPHALAWFENGRLVQKEANRAPNLKAQLASNGMVRTQQRLSERLHPHFSYLRAVCFANQGGR